MRLALRALGVLVSGLAVDRDRLAKAAADPLLFATDAAEALVRKGTPFRDAHEEVAAKVRDGAFRKPRTPRECGRAGRGSPVDRDRLAKAAADPLLFATDAAEALVRKGTPFRDAHEEVAAKVRDGAFRKPRTAAKRPTPGPGGIHEALAEARRRFADNL